MWLTPKCSQLEIMLLLPLLQFKLTILTFGVLRAHNFDNTVNNTVKSS